jgi:transcriptional regulator with XRE-family HTH domain
VRVRKGVHQHELAQVTGISPRSLKRLERHAVLNAPLWWYVNCAIALGVELEEVLDNQDLSWRRQHSERPPSRRWLEERQERGEAWGAELDDYRRRRSRGQAPEPPVGPTRHAKGRGA